MSQEDLIRQLRLKRGVWFTKHDFKVNVNPQTLNRNMARLAKSSLVYSKFIKAKRNNAVYKFLVLRSR